jgi:uncharacterized protein (TIGR04551 family)
VRRLVQMSLLLLGLAWSTVGLAQNRDISDRAEGFPSKDTIKLDIHGSVRWRTELWSDVHLGLAPQVNKYGIYPPLSADGGSGVLRETTDIRFRLKPIFHIGEKADIKGVVDLLDVRAGDGGYAGLPGLMAQSFGIDKPASMQSPHESIMVRGLWAEVFIAHLITMQVGRVPAKWGMGLVENDGSFTPDANGVDAVDGITLSAKFGKNRSMWAAASLDFPLEGTSMQSPWAPWGASYDVADMDDIWQWRLKFTSKPKANEKGSFFWWGLFARIRWQDYTSAGGNSGAEACRAAPDFQPLFDCAEFFWRDAFFFTPDGWIKASARLSSNLYLDFEAEVAARYGDMSATQAFSGEDTGKTLFGFGGVLRTGLRWDGWKAGIETGAASGDEGADAFGILDRPVVAEPDTSAYEFSPVAGNDTVTSFLLHPNFVTDMILFRSVIGGVTNAFYIKPKIEIPLFRRGENRIWFHASAMYAMAMVPSSTPGDSRALGLETDFGVSAKLTKHAEAHLEGGVLFPGEGISGGPTALADPVPWSARLLVNFSF